MNKSAHFGDENFQISLDIGTDPPILFSSYTNWGKGDSYPESLETFSMIMTTMGEDRSERSS